MLLKRKIVGINFEKANHLATISLTTGRNMQNERMMLSFFHLKALLT